MIAVVHVLAGAVIGTVFDTLPAVIIVAFFLHYLMDAIPHIDSETFASRRLPYSWKQLGIIITDAVVATTIGIIFFTMHHRWQFIVAGSIASLFPDFLIPWERYVWMSPLRSFHHLFHWDRRRARQWNWYVAGLVAPTMLVMISSAILWWSF